MAVPLLLVLALVCLVAIFQQEVAATTTLRIPGSRPAYAEYLDPHLASLSIEIDNFPVWSGEVLGQVNNYTYRLLANLGERTGRGVWLRIGGNTEDRTRVDLSVPVWARTIPPPTDEIPYHEATAVTVGRDFYALAANMPSGTIYTWGLNLRSMNVTETYAQAQHLAESFARPEVKASGVRLAGVEIGNEVDGFQVTPYTNVPITNWTPYNYTDTWQRFALNISAPLGIGSDNGTDVPSFQVGSFMSSGNAQPWNPLNVLTGPVSDAAGGGMLTTTVKGIKWWSDHFYTGVWGGGSPLAPGSLMSKGGVRGVLVSRAVDIMTARRAGLDFIIGETNSFANHGAPGVSNTAEAAIWAVDYMLQAATLGIRRVHFHNGLGYRYNLFQPASGLEDGLNITRPHILPLYHAFLIVNEAIGTSNSSGADGDGGLVRIAELGTLDRSLSAYGIWQGDKLVRMVLIDSGLFLGPTQGGGPRGQLEIELDGLPNGNKTRIRAKRLHTPRTNSYSGLTWGGQSFEMPDGRPFGSFVEQVIDNGVITMQSSEVVLLTIDD